MSKTINRRGLKGRINRGELKVKRNYRYTDDYAFDAATEYGETGYMPATYFPSFFLWLEEQKIWDEYNDRLAEVRGNWEEEQYVRREYGKKYDEAKKESGAEKGMCFDESDFKGYGSAWENEDGSITLYFGYTSFEFIEV